MNETHETYETPTFTTLETGGHAHRDAAVVYPGAAPTDGRAVFYPGAAPTDGRAVFYPGAAATK